MPYYPPYYNYCPPGYNNSYSQSVVPSYPQQQYQQPPYYNFPVYQNQQQYPSYYPKQYAYKVSFTTVDVPNGDDFSASASNTTLKFLDGSNITITGKLSDYSVTIGLKEDVTLTGGSLTLSNTSDFVTSFPTLQTIDSSGAVATSAAAVTITSAGAITDITLGIGTANGQHLTILNVGGSDITLDPVDATSNVKNSSVAGSDNLAAGHAYHFVWYASDALWYSDKILS
jgi:hypothetical protein